MQHEDDAYEPPLLTIQLVGYYQVYESWSTAACQ